MANLVIMVGVAGCGKDTWIQNEVVEKSPDKYDIHSSDDIRKELFGFYDQDNNTKVFDTMWKRTFKSLAADKHVVYNATNLSRKRRIHLYKEAKRLGHNVGIVFFSRSLKYLLDINEKREEEKQVPVDVIENMYKSIQIPREGTDCDSMIMIGDAFFSDKILENYYACLEDLLQDVVDTSVLDEIVMNYVPHDTPYHLESVNEHINMCIDAAHGPNMKLIALFHDLGKGIVKDGGRFIGHENVGAHYMYNALWHANSPNFDLAEVVFQHMNAHNGGLTPKVIRKHSLSKEVVSLTNHFAQYIDEPSRVVAEEVNQEEEK